jgi:transcriptional regulator with PAS, ATPase and Fis domain
MGISLDFVDVNILHNGVLGYISDVFGNLAEGAFVVDRQAKLLWANEQYLKFLGITDRERVIGTPISDLVENTLMPLVVQTGKSIPFDIIQVRGRWVVVSRFPIMDAGNNVIGGVCFVLADNLEPLTSIIGRVHSLQETLTHTKPKSGKVRLPKYNFSQIIGNCPQILEVKRQARQAAASDSTVLLHGETGTGKEVIAQAIHSASRRALNNFVGINVAAVPEDLMEAEFFGVAPGAYTGANPKGRVGKMALANSGTLFLDEIADMPIRMQVKLLRVLQERELEPVGSNTVTKLNIRLIAASSKDLYQLVEHGEFRADLYYRLNVVPIYVPPLRERIEDIPLLVNALLEDVCKTMEMPLKAIDQSALDFLQSRTWPGNVRELRNIIERACVLSVGSVIGKKDLISLENEKRFFSPPPMSAATSLSTMSDLSTEPELPNSVANLEKNLIVRTLGQTQGNKMLAAKKLGISRSNLYKKLEQYNL